jgi:hypothetical protein
MLDETHLDLAVERGVITREQADAMRSLATQRPLPPPRPRATVAAEVVVASTLALALAVGPLAAWTSFAGPGLLAAGGAYTALLLAAGRRLWRGPRRTAGGVLVAAAALMVPIAVHALADAIGFFPGTFVPHDLGELVRDPRVLVDVAAMAALAVALWRFHFRPLVALLTGAAWLFAMDVAPLVFGDAIRWSQRALVTAVLGASTIALGVAVDRHTREDFARWLYGAGLLAFCGALVTFDTASRAAFLLQGGLEIALVAVALLLRRRMFAVFGGLALSSSAGRAAAEVLTGPALLAFALAIAIATVAGAAAYVRVERRVGDLLRARLPPALRRLVPPGGA